MAYQTVDPYTEEVIQTFPEHTDQQLEAILAQASETYRRDWRHRDYAARATIVARAAALLAERKQDFARLATLEMGKLLREAEGEVDICVSILDYYA
jgi:succinate-semialdehyde dehydrogenase/glutarate-semialdehyde dehydrogenase